MINEESSSTTNLVPKQFSDQNSCSMLWPAQVVITSIGITACTDRPFSPTASSSVLWFLLVSSAEFCNTCNLISTCLIKGLSTPFEFKHTMAMAATSLVSSSSASTMTWGSRISQSLSSLTNEENSETRLKPSGEVRRKMTVSYASTPQQVSHRSCTHHFSRWAGLFGSTLHPGCCDRSLINGDTLRSSKVRHFCY